MDTKILLIFILLFLVFLLFFYYIKLESNIVLLLGIIIVLCINKLIVQKIVDGLHKPVFLSSPINSSDTLFIVEQHGVIRSYLGGELIDQPLLDISNHVHQPIMPGDERGLLGMA